MILEFIKALIRNASNIFSILSFLFALVAWLLPLSSENQIVVFLVFSIASVIVAAYYAWKEETEKQDKNELSIIASLRPFEPSSFIGNGMLGERQRVIIDIEFINRKMELITVRYIKLSRQTVSQEIFYDQKEIELYERKSTNIKLIFPLQIQQKSRYFIFSIIEFNPLHKDPLEFAEKLCEATDFVLDFEIGVSYMSREGQVFHTSVSGNYKNFINKTRDFWNSHDYEKLSENMTC